MPEGRIAFVCDLHPAFEVGGAQRFYGALAREFAREVPVSYLTRRFWAGPAARDEDGVEVLGLTGRVAGRGRAVVPKLAFAFAVLRHLLLRGRRYRVVHCCCFPHVALLAARLALLAHRRTLLVADWHEVLPRATWRRRLGRVGDAGWLAQRLAIGAGGAAVTFSHMHESRLRAEGRRDGVFRVPEFPTDTIGPRAGGAPAARTRTILFAGRLVAEKRPHLVPAVLAELRREDPAWRAEVFGTGPELPRLERDIDRLGLRDAVALRGFAPWEELSAAMLRASALVLPTTREGFGLVVLEASAHGLPAVLVAEPDNAAVELVDPDHNGRVCASATPAEMARAVLELAADPGVHARAERWYREHRAHYSVQSCAESLRAVHERMVKR